MLRMILLNDVGPKHSMGLAYIPISCGVLRGQYSQEVVGRVAGVYIYI